MKQSPSDKYTIAWFKLAEFISRGEKEKALGIYRLLALSIDDNAFVNKLEGDILYSFNDKSAEDKYYKAAILYYKDNKLIETAAIYENLVDLNPDSLEYLSKLIDLYKTLSLNSRLFITLNKIFICYLKNKSVIKAIDILEEIEEFSSDNSELYESLIFESINQKIDNKIIKKYIKKLLNCYFCKEKKNNLQQFLSKLEITDDYYYQETLKQINDKDEN